MSSESGTPPAECPISNDPGTAKGRNLWESLRQVSPLLEDADSVMQYVLGEPASGWVV